MILQRLTFLEFASLDVEQMQELKAIYKMAKWDGCVLGWQRKPLHKMPYIQVVAIRNWFKKGNAKAALNAVCLSYGLQENQVLNANSFEVVRAAEAIIHDLEKLLKREAETLVFPEDAKYKQAAGDKLEKFNIYNVLDSVTNRDRTKWEWAKNTPYITIFTILHKNCVEAQIEADYRRLLKLK